jgi:hypothetical protein
MTIYHWPATRAQLVEWFRDEQPIADTEQHIIDVFEALPQRVLNEAERIRDELARGAPIRSAWAVLRSRLYTNAGPAPDIIATDQTGRAKAIAAAERFIANAGLHLDREQELHETLFDGSFGEGNQTLQPWANDQALHARMLEHWRRQRPRGERAETEALAYQERLRLSRLAAQELQARRHDQTLEATTA